MASSGEGSGPDLQYNTYIGGPNEEDASKAALELYAVQTVWNAQQEVRYIGQVKKHRKKDVVDRWLVVGEFSLFFAKQTKKGSFSTGTELALLNASMFSSLADKVIADFPNRHVVLQTDDAGEVLNAIIGAYYACTVGWPDDKLARIRADNPPARPDPHQPGGGVAAGYGARCVADGIHVSYSLLEFLRDTEMVRDERSLDLREWVDVHDKAVSLIPLAAALEHNAWFTHLTISGATRPKFLFLLAGILASNSTLEVIAFSDCGFKQGLTAVCETFVTRAGRLALHDISLAGNPGLKTKDFVGFAGDGLGALPSLSHLDLSRNDLPPPVFSALFQVSDGPRLEALSHVNLADNRVGADGTAALVAWMTRTRSNNLVTMILRNTSLDVFAFSPAIVASVSPSLLILDVGENAVSDKASLALTASLRSSHVTDLDVSGCTGSVLALSGVVCGLVTLERVTMAHINFVPFSSQSDYEMLAVALSPAVNLMSLSLEECSLGAEGILEVVNTIKHLPSLKRLDLSANIRGGKREKSEAREIKANVSRQLAAYVSAYALEALYIRGTKRFSFGEALVPVIEAVGMSNTMLEFDFEGNAVGDRGLVAMLQAMQSSASLTFVSLDNNGMSLSTYEALIETLIGGDGRINVPMPVIDIKRIFKNLGNDRMERALSAFHAAAESINLAAAEAEDDLRRISRASAAIDLEMARREIYNLSESESDSGDDDDADSALGATDRFIDPGPAGSLGRDPLNAGKTVANRSSAAGRGRTSHSSSSRNSARMLTANRMSVRASGGGGAGGGGAGGGGTGGGGGQRLLMRKIYSQMPIDARAKHRSSMVSMAGTDDKYRRGKKRQLPLPPGAGGGGDGPSGAATTTSTGVTTRNFAPLPDATTQDGGSEIDSGTRPPKPLPESDSGTSGAHAPPRKPVRKVTRDGDPSDLPPPPKPTRGYRGRTNTGSRGDASPRRGTLDDSETTPDTSGDIRRANTQRVRLRRPVPTLSGGNVVGEAAGTGGGGGSQTQRVTLRRPPERPVRRGKDGGSANGGDG